jgi:Protein of unknown function (DUF2786)
MTELNRASLLAKVRALLSKTMGAGCTEHEALAALAKARAMVDAYEISDAELALTREEKAILYPVHAEDKHSIRSFLANTVARFCNAYVYRDKMGALVYVGLPSDAQQAAWMVETLAVFVQGELASYLLACMAPKGERRRVINGFVGGCTYRICERLKELMAAPVATRTDSSRALVVVQQAKIKEALESAGVKLGKPTRSRREKDFGAYQAGRAAGDRASFGKPVGVSKLLTSR